MAKVLVKIIIDSRADALSNDLKFLRAQPEARAVKLVMPDGSTMADMVRAALVKADFDSQYQCVDVSYHDEDFNEDVYISPSSLIELQTIYKVIVSKTGGTAPGTPSYSATAGDDLTVRADSFVRSVNNLLPSLMSVPSAKPLSQQPSALSNYYPGDRYGSNFSSLGNYRSGNQLEDKFLQTSSSYVDYLHLRATNSQQHSYPSQDDLFRQHELESYNKSNLPDPADMYRDRHDATASQPFYDYATYDQQPSNSISPLGSYPRNARRNQYYGEQHSSTYFFGQSAYTDPTQYYYGKKIKQKREQLNGGEKAKEGNSKETIQPPKPNTEIQPAKPNQEVQVPKPDQVIQAPKPTLEAQAPETNPEVQPLKPNQEVVQLNSESTSAKQGSNGNVKGVEEKESEKEIESPEYEPLEGSEQQNETADPQDSVSKLQSASKQQKKETTPTPKSKPFDKKKKRSYNAEVGVQIPSLFESPIIRSSPRMMRPMPGALMQRSNYPAYPQLRPLFGNFGSIGGGGGYPPSNPRQPMFPGDGPPMRGPSFGYSPTPGYGMPRRGEAGAPNSLADLCRKFPPY